MNLHIELETSRQGEEVNEFQVMRKDFAHVWEEIRKEQGVEFKKLEIEGQTSDIETLQEETGPGRSMLCLMASLSSPMKSLGLF